MRQISEWKIKLRTPLDSELRKNEETGEDYLVYHHTQYEFTIEEALRYICSNEFYSYMFEDMMLHNVVLRDAMRNFGVRKVVDNIREFAPDSKALRERMDSFIEDHPEGSIGNFNIQLYSTEEDVEILGHVFHGLDDIIAYKEIALYERCMSKKHAYGVVPVKRGDIHVGEVWQNYPCFDSSDYATETRSYQNYVIRKTHITSAEMQRVRDLPAEYSFNKITEEMPTDVLPLVYYSGDGGFMLVATRRN